MSEIIHVDLDGFFVAVERQIDPRLAARPVVIGGQPSTHGVVVAACPEATRRGVRPGLSLAIAAARCPDAAFLDGAVERYLEASAAVDEILRDPHLTGAGAAVEWTAIDSVFIEVGAAVSAGASGAAASGDGLRVAERLRERLVRELGFDVSCGIARTRAAAQIASRISRPRGVLYALPGYEARLLAPLDVGLLPDLPVGARQRLMMDGVMTLGDLAGVCDERAKALLGTRGPSFVRWARAEDDRPVDRSQPPRSIAREVTLTHPDAPETELADVVRHLADVLALRLRSMGWFARTVTLRLRPPSSSGSPSAAPASSGIGMGAVGSSGSPSAAAESSGVRESAGPATRPQPNRLVRSVTLREATAQGEDLRAAAASLLKVLWRRQPVGGLGLVLSNLQPTGPQMPLFPLARPESASATADTLRVRSGLRVLVDQRYVSAGRRYAGRGSGGPGSGGLGSGGRGLGAQSTHGTQAGAGPVERQLPLRHRRTG
jgi:nucleotidyltransferase/DNA polymerase involved in DNA repair